jgi:hypothetical protein
LVSNTTYNRRSFFCWHYIIGNSIRLPGAYASSTKKTYFRISKKSYLLNRLGSGQNWVSRLSSLVFYCTLVSKLLPDWIGEVQRESLRRFSEWLAYLLSSLGSEFQLASKVSPV